MASVPLPHQFAVGEAATSTNINTYYSAISYLENPPIATMYQVGAQNVGSGGEVAIALDSTSFDTYNGHSNSVNNTRYTFQVAGMYLVAGLVAWSPNATGVRGASLRLNGTTDVIASQVISPTITIGGINTNVPTRTCVIQVNVNDYVELMGTQTSGAGLNTNTGSPNQSGLSICWLHA